MGGEVGRVEKGAVEERASHDSKGVQDARQRRRGRRVRTPPPADLGELEDALFDHGVHTYSIFLDPATSDLFGYVEIESEERWAAIADTDVCQRWWRHMRDVMPANPDASPVSRDLREVFHVGR